LGTVVWALSLKMTSLRRAVEETLPWLLIRRLAIVSTGWKMASSAMPAEPGGVSLRDGWGDGGGGGDLILGVGLLLILS